MNECPYVGIEFDVMTDVIISVILYLHFWIFAVFLTRWVYGSVS